MEPSESTSPDSASPPVARAKPYEFDAEQNKLFAALGSVMRNVGLGQIALGILVGILGLVSLVRSPVGVGNLLQGALMVLIGSWVRTAGGHFQSVADTTGADIEHLTDALTQLRQLYGLQWVLLVIGLILIPVAMIAAIILAASVH